MKIRLLAGAACAALLGLSVPAHAAASPELPGAAIQVSPSAMQAVNTFYASRHGAPLWLRSGADSGAARMLIGVLERAPLDGLDSGPALAAQARMLLARAATGDPAALTAADRLLSAAWVSYVTAIERPPSGMIYADSWVTPRRDTPMQILQKTAAADSIANHVRSISQVNPLYAQLRDTAWAQMQAGRLTRAGLVATNSIRGGANRAVLREIVKGGRIFEAWPDEEWTVDGAAVRVSLGSGPIDFLEAALAS